MTSDELSDLRLAVRNLSLDADEAGMDDEAWYDRLWILLDPVIDARAYRALAIHTHDAGEYRDPSTGEVLDRELEAHRFSFEGSTTLLARHLVDEHDVLLGAVEPYAGGLSQGAWIALDDLHKGAHREGLTS